MTREEAIKEIEERVQTTKYVGGSYVDCVDIEALRMAIEALQQPEIVLCNECRRRGTSECPMWFEEIVEYEEDGFIEHDWVVHDYTRDEGYCDRGER